MNQITFIFISVLLAIHFNFIHSQDGFATLGDGTTGGNGGNTATVCTLDEFLAAVVDDDPRIVRVICHIQPGRRVPVGSNKSILGASTDTLISGKGFYIYRKKNIIIRRLRFCCAVIDDEVGINESTNIWIDHNEFYSDIDHHKDYYDGLIDIVKASDFITISYNQFHDHWKTILIGHEDENGYQDIGKLHITLHHNHFFNCYSRQPSIRFGTAHIYNNLYENVLLSGINSRMGAEVLVESNVFRTSTLALTTSLDSIENGYAVERNNDFGEAELDITQNGTFLKPPYSYRRDQVSKVPHIVKQNAGATILF